VSRQLRTIAAVFAALALAVAVPATTLAAPGSGPVLLSGFGASPIYVGGSSTVWFRINGNDSGGTGFAFTDTLPAGLVVGSPAGVTNSCGGAVTASAGSNGISLSSGVVLSSATCLIEVNVKATTPGVKPNTTSSFSWNGGTGANPETALLTVIALPTVAVAFNPTSISIGGTSTLTFTITNPNPGNVNPQHGVAPAAVGLSGIHFSDTLPAGLVITDPNGFAGNCDGKIDALAGTNVITLSDLFLPAATNCWFSVTVKATTSGAKKNSTGPVGSQEDVSGDPGLATLYVGVTPSRTSTADDPAPVNGGLLPLLLGLFAAVGVGFAVARRRVAVAKRG
jgi:hypothetical protein